MSQQSHLPSGGSKENLFSCLPAARGHSVLWLLAPSSIFKASSRASSDLFDSDCLPGTLDFSRPTYKIQDTTPPALQDV